MPADAGLGTLSHFDFNGGARLQIVLMHAEAAGSDLHNGVFSVTVKIFMQSALAGVVANSDLFGGARQTLMGVIADGAVAHGGEHDRHGKLNLRRQLAVNIAACIPIDLRGLFA